MKILHIDSSASTDSSATRTLTGRVVEKLMQAHPGSTVIQRDLDRDPLPHFSSRTLAGEEVELGESVLREFEQADAVVVGAPMYNFGIPSALKAWIDRIAVAGRTFRYTAQGPQGLAGEKAVVVVSARGGLYGENSPADFQEAYLRQVFGFLGTNKVHVVRAEGLAMAGEARGGVLDKAMDGLTFRQNEALAA